MIDRRQFLALLGAGASSFGLKREASAFGSSASFLIAQLEYSGDWNPRDGAARKLLLEVEKRTSVRVDPTTPAVKAEGRALFEHPFLIWSGSGAFEELSESEVENLAIFLRAGGFLFIDSCEGVEDGGFDQSIRRELARIVPGESLQSIQEDHVIYKSFYLLDQPYGRVDVDRVLKGVQRDDRMMLVYGQNDTAGAWARDNFGQYVYDVTPGGERQRELAYRFGINLVMYALCVNYKADQVHIPFILKKRQWKLE